MSRRQEHWTHDGRHSRGKKGFMIQFWRMQQSQAFVNSFFFATTLALLLMPYVGDRLTGVTHSAIAAFALLFGFVMALILLFGYAFDVVWKLWKEQVVVGTERNPYALEKVNAKEAVVWRILNLPMLRAMGRQREADLMEAWLQATLREDPRLAKDVEALQGWLEATASSPVHPKGVSQTEPLSLGGGEAAGLDLQLPGGGPVINFRK